MADHVCVDCGEPLSEHSPKWTKRCRNCSIAYRKKNAEPTKPCPDCGKPIRKSSKRCRDCFYKEKAKKKDANKNYCPDCGKEILRSSKRCWECSVKAKRGRDRSIEQPVAPRQVCPECGGYKHHLATVCNRCYPSSDSENVCGICGVPIYRYATVCRECWDAREINYNACIDCGEIIHNNATRCGACYGIYRSKTFVGENHPAWNPEISEEERAKRRDSDEYIRWREVVCRRDDYTCQICGKHDIHINVHHLESYAIAKSLRFDVANGVSLCKDCHVDFHKRFGYGDNTRKQFIQYVKEMDVNYSQPPNGR